jgi:plasmid stability protein
MATLTVRKLDDTVYSKLGERAKRNNRSLEAEVREILKESAADFDLDRWLAKASELRERTPPRTDGKTSLDLLKDDRSGW